MSAVTVFTTSTGLRVVLSSFPLASAGSGRRAGAGGCAAGFEWRYARGGTVACECPANTLCAGETTCSLMPKAQEQWQVLNFPVTACATPPQTTSGPAAILPSATTSTAPVLVTPPSPPNVTVPAESPPLGLILGLILGLGVPVLLGAGAASAYAVSRGKRASADGGSVKPTTLPLTVLPELEAQAPAVANHGAAVTLPPLSAASASGATAGVAAEAASAAGAAAAIGWHPSGVHLSSSLAFPTAGEAALPVVADDGLMTMPLIGPTTAAVTGGPIRELEPACPECAPASAGPGFCGDPEPAALSLSDPGGNTASSAVDQARLGTKAEAEATVTKAVQTKARPEVEQDLESMLLTWFDGSAHSSLLSRPSSVDAEVEASISHLQPLQRPAAVAVAEGVATSPRPRSVGLLEDLLLQAERAMREVTDACSPAVKR